VKRGVTGLERALASRTGDRHGCTDPTGAAEEARQHLSHVLSSSGPGLSRFEEGRVDEADPENAEGPETHCFRAFQVVAGAGFEPATFGL
jgi:hypothetical protein